MRVRFEVDPEFRENVYRASNKQGSSLRGLYDQVRAKTDDIAKAAKDSIGREQGVAEGLAGTLRAQAAHGDNNDAYRIARARAFSLRSAWNSTVPTMGFDGTEIYGRVIINRKGSVSLEFGGADPVAEIGFGTGNYINHPPYAFLRRAADREG